MKQLRLRVLWLALVAAGSVGVARGQTAADVDAVVQRMVGARMPAAGVAVVRNGNVVLAKAYGSADIEGGIAAGENTAFQIASVTKQFTAAAVMMLVEEGTLALDDPVGTYVADVPATWKGVTIRQLMNQVSGYRTAPRTDGSSMTRSTRTPRYLKAQGEAAGYRLVNGQWEKAARDDPSQPWAAGAIVSTPADMAKGATAVGEGKLLKKTSWDKAFAPTGEHSQRSVAATRVRDRRPVPATRGGRSRRAEDGSRHRVRASDQPVVVRK